MKILIATGIYPPDVGGPANYAKSLNDEFIKLGYCVVVMSYGIEKRLPVGIRHVVFFLKMIFALRGIDFVIALDTFSVGFPSVLASLLLKKKIIIRTGGDFLWEQYVNRTSKKVPLVDFYNKDIIFSSKEKIIFKITKFVLHKVDAIAFSTNFQKNIFSRAYSLNKEKTYVIENFYEEKKQEIAPMRKDFLWAGRDIPLKNLEYLKKAFNLAKESNNEIELNMITGIKREELLNKIKKSYAVILPSFSEISPNFILEAVAYNKPFIVTKHTGLVERLKEFGCFIDPFDIKSISESILLLSDSVYYYNKKENLLAFNFVHSYKEISEEFLSIYRKI